MSSSSTEALPKLPTLVKDTSKVVSRDNNNSNQQLISVKQDTMAGIVGDWRPFVFGGFGSVAAEFGKKINIFFNNLILFYNTFKTL